MLASQRKQQILQILTEEKQVMSGELSQRFNVSEDSIRRDLRELAAEGKLQRVHGGALPVSAAIAPIETRKSVQIASKQAVARAAAALIQPGQVVIVDGGTTTAAMIGFLPADLSCTVVTHSPGIAVALVVLAATIPSFNIPVAGILLLMGIDHFLDMGRSAINVLGNGIATAMLSKNEGLLTDEEAQPDWEVEKAEA